MENKRFSRNIIRYFNRIRIKSYFFSSCLSFLFVLILKRTPFASQKDSFCSSKVPLLQCKRTTFVEADFSIRSENKDVPLPRKAEGTQNQKNSHYFRIVLSTNTYNI